ncbi:hypothetical protein OED52_13760 [Rhodococcus sp. Z13]|uniref:Uncharacterized protein n=1 Tax=Rhodococcus sacchari TaxID=2962047 RepID=A0ACD4DCF5_9NOCA|nr:hypothetical protein [Rhodococcus sp. Z13]UYP17738.1 hypothetical protein OED52_13760 [Rhodococcus sp. Z13]
MADTTSTLEFLSPVVDPETGQAYESGGHRLTVQYACDCGNDLRAVVVLPEDWDSTTQPELVEQLEETLRSECCA